MCATTLAGRLVELPGMPVSIGKARSFVAGVLGTVHPCCEIACLLVSEVATNAITHTRSGEAGGRFTLCVAQDDGEVRVTVDDEGAFTVPEMRVNSDDESGRGLFLVNELADRWGTLSMPRGRRVYFVLSPAGVADL